MNLNGTVDGSLKSGVYQLRLVVYSIIYEVLHIPGAAGFQPSTVCPFLKQQNPCQFELEAFIESPSSSSSVKKRLKSW